jgi:hypothetical protein
MLGAGGFLKGDVDLARHADLAFVEEAARRVQ